MARKRTESLLGLPPLPPQSGFESTLSLTLAGNNRGLTKREKGIYFNLHERERVIDAVTRITEFGIESMNKAKREAGADVMYTLQYLDEVKDETKLTHSQAVFDEFHGRLTTLSARHTLGAVDMNGTLIASEISNPLYPTDEELEELEEAPEPEPPKNFFQRLLGG